jgi:CCR4-NOT transcription complex subunit 3
MAANRKLMAEIQQVLKKVEEGVEVFDEIWEKVYAASGQNLKEKYEGDLKKEIKKLQRLRDQIKAWIGSAEVKDKNQLTEARKTIESKMEQFKICEKDTKTKAYSKEGLARADKLDPKEAEKEERRVWLNEALDKLTDMINGLESEIEKLASGKSSKKSKADSERAEARIKQHQWHTRKIEVIIRKLDLGDLEPTAVDGVREDLEYYLETAAEDDGTAPCT